MKKKRKKTLKFGLIIFVAGAVFFVHTIYEQQKTLNKYKDDLHNLQTKIEEVNEDNDELAKEKSSMFTDENMEKVAREKLGMVKPGEKVFVDVGQ